MDILDRTDLDTLNNEELNQLISKLYNKKASSPGGGVHTKVSIQTLSSADIAFNKNEKYYEWLKITLFNNLTNDDVAYVILFQKNNTNNSESIYWWFDRGTYEGRINFGFQYNRLFSKSENRGNTRPDLNIFIINYDER